MSQPWNARSLVLPLFGSIGALVVAPFLGVLRDALLEALPRAALGLLAGTFGLAIAVALGVAIRRIRENRVLRYWGVGISLALVGAQLEGFATGHEQVDAVERFHIVEYGLLVLLFHRALLPLAGGPLVALLATVWVGIADEWVQWTVSTRVGEVGDVWLNGAAALTGSVFAHSLFPPIIPPWRLGHAGRRRVVWMVVPVVLTFAWFVDQAHLGYEIHDPEANLTFRSWHSPELLAAAARDRELRWAAGDMPAISPLRLQDVFLTEATAHIAHRNTALSAGDHFAAWREQLVLERHYAAVLPLHGLSSGEPFALPAEQRKLVAQDAGRFPHLPYQSPVLDQRVWLKPSGWWWWSCAVLVSVACIGIGIGSRLPRRG